LLLNAAVVRVGRRRRRRRRSRVSSPCRRAMFEQLPWLGLATYVGGVGWYRWRRRGEHEDSSGQWFSCAWRAPGSSCKFEFDIFIMRTLHSHTCVRALQTPRLFKCIRPEHPADGV
jgi:hypothetical protein